MLGPIWVFQKAVSSLQRGANLKAQSCKCCWCRPYFKISVPISRLSRNYCNKVTFYYSYKMHQHGTEDKIAIRDVRGDDTVLSYLREDCKERGKAAWHGSRNSGPSQVIWSTLLLVPWLWTHISAWVNTLVSSEIQVLVIPVPWHFCQVFYLRFYLFMVSFSAF